MGDIRAHEVKGIRRAMNDGKMGLLGFERARPDSQGNDEIWIACPVFNLPMVAVAAIKAIPQPESPSGKHPVVFEAEVIQFGLGALDELVLTIEFQEGASLSLKLTEHQSSLLAEGIQKSLAEVRRHASNKPH